MAGWVAGAVALGGLYSGYQTGKAGDKSANASLQASQLQAQGEREALQYQMDVERLPLEMRDRFLPQLAGIAEGGPEQQQLIDSSMNSPLYQSIMGGQQVGEEAILRNASMTGGMRSGNTQGTLTDYGSQLSNQALLESYNQQLQGIQGLAQQPLNTNAIAQGIAAPSSTIASGQVAAAQSQQMAQQNQNNMYANLAGAGLQAYGQYRSSDIRLKDNIQFHSVVNDHNIYTWDWNDKAKEIGLEGQSAGVMAHEVYEYMPDAIGTVDGFLAVDMVKLGLMEAPHAG